LRFSKGFLFLGRCPKPQLFYFFISFVLKQKKRSKEKFKNELNGMSGLAFLKVTLPRQAALTVSSGGHLNSFWPARESAVADMGEYL
jgi:hypothetical protein